MPEQVKEYTQAGSREAVADSWEYCYGQSVVIEPIIEEPHDHQQ